MKFLHQISLEAKSFEPRPWTQAEYEADEAEMIRTATEAQEMAFVKAHPMGSALVLTVDEIIKHDMKLAPYDDPNRALLIFDYDEASCQWIRGQLDDNRLLVLGYGAQGEFAVFWFEVTDNEAAKLQDHFPYGLD